jgi:hypothetical protein
MAERKPDLIFWLEDVLGGRTLPVGAIAVVAAAGGLYLLGLLDEEHTAAIAVAVVALWVGLYLVHRAVGGTGAGRVLGLAAAAATLLAVALPAIPTVWPGKAVFEGQLGAEGDRLPLPPEAVGRIRLLVAGRLGEGGEPSASYVIEGVEPPVHGKLERVYRQVRVGRSGRARVAADHTADWFDGVVRPGTTALTLQRVSGRLGGPLLVSGHRPLVPAPWPWALAGGALLLAAVAEAQLGRGSGLAVPAGMALAFGLLVTDNATPFAAVGPVLGGAVLGAIVGSLAGWIAGVLARRLLPRAGPS